MKINTRTSAPGWPPKYLLVQISTDEDRFYTFKSEDLITTTQIKDVNERFEALMKVAKPTKVHSTGSVDLILIPDDTESWDDLTEFLKSET